MEKPPIVFQLPDTGEWAVGEVKTIHPTKGAADKAANKTKTSVLSKYIHELPKVKDSKELSLGVPDRIVIYWEDKQLTFNLFENRSRMCVAICNTPGYENFFGKSTIWWDAVEECLTNIVTHERANS